MAKYIIVNNYDEKRTLFDFINDNADEILKDINYYGFKYSLLDIKTSLFINFRKYFYFLPYEQKEIIFDNEKCTIADIMLDYGLREIKEKCGWKVIY